MDDGYVLKYDGAAELHEIGPYLFILIAGTGLPLAVWGLVWSTRRLQRASVVDCCSGCDYELRGLSPSAVCPECGLERGTIRSPDRAFERAVQRVCVALLPVGVMLFVATTVGMLTTRAADIPQFGAAVAAPYLVLTVATFVLHRESKLRRSVWRVLAPTAVGTTVLLMYVLFRVNYWWAPIGISGSAFLVFCILCVAWGITNAEELLDESGRWKDE